MIVLPSVLFNILNDFICVSYNNDTNISDRYDD
jgi:hypothetical protein